MSDQNDGSQKSGQSQAVTDLLHQDTGGAKRGRCNEGAAVVVHNHTDGDVQRGHDELTQREGLEVVLVVLHLRDDVEVRRGASIGKDDAGQRSRSFGKGGALEQLKVRLPGPELGCRRGAVLETDRHGEGDDWLGLELIISRDRRRRTS